MRLCIAGELFGFGYGSSKPSLHYFVLSAGGMVKSDIQVSIPDATMMHDFAMTEDFVIFLDFPLISNPEVCCVLQNISHIQVNSGLVHS